MTRSSSSKSMGATQKAKRASVKVTSTRTANSGRSRAKNLDRVEQPSIIRKSLKAGNRMLTDKELAKEIDRVIRDFHGQSNDLGNALGAFMLGKYYGWKPIMLMYSRASIRKYEKILGMNFKERLPEEGELVHKLKAYRFLRDTKAYWDTIRSGKKVKDSKVISKSGK